MYNYCRRITAVRNVVERLFSLLKKWTFLRYEHSIHYDPYKVHLIFQIVCSFHNAFGGSLYQNNEQREKDIDQILTAETDTNVLFEEESKTKSGWVGQKEPDLKRLRDSIMPEFSLEDLRTLAAGPYVLRLAIPYYQHANKIKYMRHKNHPYTIRTDGIISRHTRNDANKLQYKVYHRFHESGDFLKTRSYCTCGVGKRTVCPCAHMVASLYVLYHRLHNKELPQQTEPTDTETQKVYDRSVLL